MKKYRTYLISTIVITLVFGCKKYPEGPKISLRTIKHRLSGDWEITRFEVNGVDSLAYLESHKVNIGDNYRKEKSIYTPYSSYTTFKAENDKYNSSGVNIGLNREALFFETDNYNNDQNFVKKHLRYQYLSVYGDTVDYYGFRILKLTKQELKLRTFKTAIFPRVIEFKRI